VTSVQFVLEVFWPRLFDLASVAGHPTSRAEGRGAGTGERERGSGIAEQVLSLPLCERGSRCFFIVHRLRVSFAKKNSSTSRSLWTSSFRPVVLKVVSPPAKLLIDRNQINSASVYKWSHGSLFVLMHTTKLGGLLK